jgi:hypothetical protein
VVAHVGGYGPHSSPGVAWCSVKNNEAVIFENTMGENSATAVRLSDGAILSDAWIGSNQNELWSALSGNGKYALRLGSASEVIDTSTGDLVGTIPGQGVAISWAGHDVVSLLNGTNQVEVIDWVTNKVVWLSGPPITKCPCVQPGVTAVSQSGTDNLALTISSQPGQASGQGALWLITDSYPPRLLDSKTTAGA